MVKEEHFSLGQHTGHHLFAFLRDTPEETEFVARMILKAAREYPDDYFCGLVFSLALNIAGLGYKEAA